MSDETPLWTVIEALCVTLNRPVRLTEIAKICGVQTREVSAAIAPAEEALAGHGIMLQHDATHVQIVTHPSVAWAMERALAPERHQRLSKSAVETLAIVAYRQPVQKSAIDHLRGVDCERVLETLERRGLIAVQGHDEAPGSPRLWGTTLEFLRLLGIPSIEALPALDEETLHAYERAFDGVPVEESGDGTD